MCSTFYTSSNLPDNNLDILSITVYRFNFIGCLQMYNKYISSISLSNKKPQLSTCMTRRKKKIVKCGFFSICIFCRNVFFFFFFWESNVWSKKRQGERSTNHKKMVNWFIMREIVGLESFQLLKICRKVQGKRRERERGQEERERGQFFKANENKQNNGRKGT